MREPLTPTEEDIRRGYTSGRGPIDSSQRFIDGSYENEHHWPVPERIGDTAIRQVRIEDRLDSME